MKIGKNVKPSIPPVPGGTYMAVCIYSLGIGEQLCKYKDSTRYNNQVMIGFELIGQTVEIDGKQEPRVLGRTFNIAKSQNSGLRKFLGSWMGKALTDDEYMSFDTNTLLGKPAMLSVVLNDTGEYANIDGIMQIPAGIPEPKATITPFRPKEEAMEKGRLVLDVIRRGLEVLGKRYPENVEIYVLGNGESRKDTEEPRA